MELPRISPQPKSPQDLSRRGRQLHEAAKKGLQIFLPGTADTIEYDFLAEATQRIRGNEWGENPTNAFGRLVESAVNKLETLHIERRYLTDCALSWRDIGEIMYKADPGVAKMTNKSGNLLTYSDRKKLLKEKSGGLLEGSKLDRQLLLLCEILVHILHDMTPEEPPNQVDPDYVSRLQLEEKIHSAIVDNKHVILLHGEPGMGKSTLAEHVVRHYANRPAIIVARTEELLADTLADALEAYKSLPNSTDPLTLRREFRKLLAKDDAPPATLLDNLPDGPEGQLLLKSLVSPEPKGRIFITSRRLLELSGNSEAIPVSAMSPDEAKRMIRSILGEISDDHADNLARTLGFRPLAIEHGCTCLKSEPFSGDIPRFCQAVRENVTILDRHGGEDDSTLSAIYSLIFEQLAPFPAAVQLLALVALFGPAVAHADEVIPLVWTSTTGSGTTDSDFDAVDIRQARDILVGRNLIEDIEAPPTSRYGQSFGRVISMHELTSIVILHIRRACEYIPSFIDNMHRRVFSAGQWSGGYPLPNGFPAIYGALNNLNLRILGENGRGMLDDTAGTDSDYLLAVAIRQRRSVGRLTEPFCQQVLRNLHGADVAVGKFRGRSAIFTEAASLGLTLGGTPAVNELNTEMATKQPLAFVFDSLMSGQICKSRSPSFSTLDSKMGRDSEILSSFVADIDTIGWIYGAMYRYRFGVANMERANWPEAEGWYLWVIERCNDRPAEDPIAQTVKIETVGRLIELAMYKHDEEMRGKWLDQAPRLDLGLQSAYLDRVLLERTIQRQASIMVNAMLRSPKIHIAMMKAILEGTLDRLIEDFRCWGLHVPALECELDRWILSCADDGKEREKVAHAEKLIEECAARAYAPGEFVIKLLREMLCIHAADRSTIEPIDMTAMTHRALRMAEMFERNNSHYWEAMSLVLALVACYRENGGPGNPAGFNDPNRYDRELKVIFDRTRTALERISRMDKLADAVQVGLGLMPAKMLLSR